MPETVQLGLTPGFMRSLQALTVQEQGQVTSALMGLAADSRSAGLNIHPIKGADQRLRSVRASQDLRIICQFEGDLRILLYADHHDRAYDWSRRHRLDVHPVTGTAQIVETVERVEEKVVEVEREMPLPPLFAGESDDYLLSLGVPPAWTDTVRALQTVEQLMGLCGRLPDEAWEALAELADGRRPDPRPRPAPGADPFATADARRRFRTFGSETDLLAALERPWEEWAVYLHPTQWDAVEKDFSGPARVTGPAGTGKSVVAMHRAARLARREGARVLLSTFTSVLAQRLSDGMDVLLRPGTPERGRVDVLHLHGIARRLMADAGRRVDVATDDDIRALIARHRGGLDPERWPDGFLFAEWLAVIDYWGVAEWHSYRAIPRTGRGARLAAEDRETLWPVFAGVRSALADAGRLTWNDLCGEAAALLEAGEAAPFDHVVLDEAQDFGPRELHFASLLARSPRNGLFFAGDVGQRIYKFPFSWAQLGINVRGRSVRLRVNYRTSGEIRSFADALLPRALEEIGGGEEGRTARSLFSGPEPRIVPCADRHKEASVVGRFVAEALERGLAPREIAILGRTSRRVRDVAAKALKHLSVGHQRLKDDRADAVYADTLHAAKGLEFRLVAIVGCEDGELPLKKALDAEIEEEARAQAEARERHLLYVGCTRARDELLVTHVGRPSRFLAYGGGAPAVRVNCEDR